MFLLVISSILFILSSFINSVPLLVNPCVLVALSFCFWVKKLKKKSCKLNPQKGIGYCSVTSERIRLLGIIFRRWQHHWNLNHCWALLGHDQDILCVRQCRTNFEMCFQEDATTARTVRAMMQLFGYRKISQNYKIVWLPCFPDLTFSRSFSLGIPQVTCI